MATAAAAEKRKPFGLPLAFGLSILLHALLVLLSLWVPLTRSASFTPTLEAEQTLTFDFSRDELESPKAETFVPIEPAPPLARPSSPWPRSPEIQPVGAEEPTQEPENAGETVSGDEWPGEAQPVPGTIQPDAPPGAVLPELPDQRAVQGPAAAPREPDGSLDMQRALREFDPETVARPPASRSPSPSSAVPQNVIVPDLSSIPVSGFGVGNLEFESRDYDWSDYGRQIYVAIWRAWHNRLWATTDEFEKWAHLSGVWRLDHATRVRFVIERNGQVTGIVREAGSRCEPLDLSALVALEEVILPPLPAGFPREREVVHARFLAEGPVRGMRPTLNEYKSMGLF